MKNRSIALSGIYPIIILSMVFWGMSFVWTSIVLTAYSPITTIFLRLVLSSILLMAFVAVTRKFERIRKEDYKYFIISSFFNPFLYFIGENYGVKLSSPAIASMVIATIPVFAPVFGYFIFKEKLSPLNIFGIFISFAGISLMLVNRDLSLNADPVGVLFLLFAVFSAVIYSVFLKRLSATYSALVIISYQNLIGVILFMPFFLYFDINEFLLVRPSVKVWTSLLQLSFFASSLAFIFFTMGVKKLGISRSNVFGNLIPVFTAVFSYIFISESFTFNKVSGMIVVISGVLLAQIKKKPYKNLVS